MLRMRTSRVRWVITSGLLTGASVFALPSCERVLTTFNPCSNVFEFCDENDIALLFNDPLKGESFDIDPSCTIPFLIGCSAGNVLPRP